MTERNLESYQSKYYIHNNYIVSTVFLIQVRKLWRSSNSKSNLAVKVCLGNLMGICTQHQPTSLSLVEGPSSGPP